MPNEVNGDYNKFKVMIYTILEKMIVSTSCLNTSQEQLNNSDSFRETLFFLDFSRVSDTKKFVFILVVKKVFLSENEEEIIKLINESKNSTTLTSFYTDIKHKHTDSIK